MINLMSMLMFGGIVILIAFEVIEQCNRKECPLCKHSNSPVKGTKYTYHCENCNKTY